MRIDVLTLFPEYFRGILETSLLGKAIQRGLLEVRLHQIRDYATDRHAVVDDAPYGGGSGMVMKIEPLVRALEAVSPPGSTRILLSARGRRFTQTRARELAEGPGFVLVCGRYEGVDERIAGYIDEQVCIGDYVLSGGEAGASVLIDAVSRLIPGVLGNPGSLSDESFGSGILEYPQYTRPEEFRGARVPDVLLSGDHGKVAHWRQEAAEKATADVRPDLLSPPSRPGKAPLYVALLHHPVLNRAGATVASSLTNLDVHDIARSGRTYGVRRFYVVHPVPGLRALSERVVAHWRTGYGSRYNPSRREALDRVEVQPDLDHVLAAVEQDSGRMPRLVGTSARIRPGTMSCRELREILATSEDPYLMLLGTGYGMTEEVLARCDIQLEPISGVDDYNHLSVRAAAAILLDRLRGQG